jgi:DNA polymerase III gamma/tau subunit
MSYFILCTTAPEKITPALKNRCASFSVTPLRRNQVVKLLSDAGQKMNLICGADLYEKIAEVADGVPRTALMILEQVYEQQDANLVEIALRAKFEPDVLNLARVLFCDRDERWTEVLRLFKAMDNEDLETERVRFALLSLAKNRLLETDDLVVAARMAQAITILSRPTYEAGAAKLASMLFDISLLE